MENSRVAIIVLTYNNFDLTKYCLEKLRCLKYQNKKIFLVDNCSDAPGEVEKLKELSDDYDELVQIKDYNIGFSGGMNYGMETALNEGGFDYFLCYSNDIVPEENFLTEMVNHLDRDTEIGLAGPVQYKYNPLLLRKKIYFAGATISKWLFVPQHVREITDNPPTGYINGAIFMIRRECLEQTGGFDLDYFTWYEDCDLSIRSRRLGWKLAVVTSATVWHMIAQTVGGRNFKAIKFSRFYHSRNRALLVLKNASIQQKIVFFMYMFLIQVPAMLLWPIAPHILEKPYRSAIKILKKHCKEAFYSYAKVFGLINGVINRGSDVAKLQKWPQDSSINKGRMIQKKDNN